MATNIAIAKDGKVVWRQILLKLGHNTMSHVHRNVYIADSADPVGSSGASFASAGAIQSGDFVFAVSASTVHICSVTCTSGTSAQFITCHV